MDCFNGVNQKSSFIYFILFCRLASERKAWWLSDQIIFASQSSVFFPASKRHELNQRVSEWGVSTVVAVKRGDYSSLIIRFRIRKLSHTQGRAPSSVLSTCAARKIYSSNKVFAVKLNKNEGASLLIIYFTVNET